MASIWNTLISIWNVCILMRWARGITPPRQVAYGSASHSSGQVVHRKHRHCLDLRLKSVPFRGRETNFPNGKAHNAFRHESSFPPTKGDRLVDVSAGPKVATGHSFGGVSG